MRIVLFVGSPIEADSSELTSVGKKLRKCNVAVDVVSFGDVDEPDLRQRIARSLVRLVNKEKPYKGETWWKTRPDTRGPYYYPTAWERTDKITRALVKMAKQSDPATRFVIIELAKKDRVELPGL